MTDLERGQYVKDGLPYDDPKTEDVQEDLAGPDQLLKCPVMYDGEGVDLIAAVSDANAAAS